jgi:hypothetical protein
MLDRPPRTFGDGGPCDGSSARRWYSRRICWRAATALFRRGRVPVIGVNLALPLIEIAGRDAYDEIMMSLPLAVAERCHARLRVGRFSAGADHEVARFRARGKPNYC